MFAIVQIGGKQYKVQTGDIIFVEKLDYEVDAVATFDTVLAISDESGFRVGTPAIAGAKVEANVARQGKAKKIYVMKYKPKNNDKKRKGHRQPYTKLQITSITG